MSQLSERCDGHHRNMDMIEEAVIVVVRECDSPQKVAKVITMA